MAPPGVGSNIFARLRVAESRIYNDNDVANQSVLVKRETPLNVHGVFDEIFDPQHTSASGARLAGSHWLPDVVDEVGVSSGA
jgi:hypothetical protein